MAILKQIVDYHNNTVKPKVKSMVTDISGKAPINHAVSTTTYGAGSSSNYGHVKLSDSTSSSSGVSSGTAATPAAVKAAYEKAVEAKDLAENKQDAAFDYFGFLNMYEVCDTLNDARYASRTATLVVAASNSTAKSKAAADYTCTGSGDQNMISSAISALPSSGGKIVLLEGIYNCSGSINVNKANVTIEGMGIGATTINYTGSTFSFITVSQSKCAVKNLTVTRSSTTPNYVAFDLNGTSCTNCTIDSVEISNFAYGLNATQIGSKSCHAIRNVRTSNCQIGIHINTNNCLVANCYCLDSTEHGINIEGSYNKISDNYVSNTSTSANTIRISNYGTHSYNDVSDNYLIGKNYVNDGGNTNTFSNNRYS